MVSHIRTIRKDVHSGVSDSFKLPVRCPLTPVNPGRSAGAEITPTVEDERLQDVVTRISDPVLRQSCRDQAPSGSAMASGAGSSVTPSRLTR